MNITTQIKCTLTVLAAFAALGVTSLIHAAPARPAQAAIADTRIEISAPDSNGVGTRTTRVHVGAPIAIRASSTAQDRTRAAR